MFYSPLRYPGGKNKLAKLIGEICTNNNINNHYIEPYAGGASVALYLLIENKVNSITINDYDRSIFAFWYSILYKTEKFCNLIENTDITIENWEKCKKIQKNKINEELIELGFSTFFLNRTNISGIINAGVIGGKNQNGRYKMDSRYNKKNLIKRIRLIASFKDKIELYNLDALQLIYYIQLNPNHKKVIFYFDPPYYYKGSTLYMNHYKKNQHIEVAKAIRNIKNINWIVSYDNTPEIEGLYDWVPKKMIKKYYFNHSAYRSRIGNEILFFSEKLTFDKIIFSDFINVVN